MLYNALSILRKEIKDGVEDLISKIKRLKPLVACFNGKGIYEIFSRSKCEIGNQPECIPGTDVTRQKNCREFAFLPGDNLQDTSLTENLNSRKRMEFCEERQ
ncbi:G/T mismatch-specific thymine DNA glycosylase [Exaiptasia diaphana]|nr:G/T mismatch-specific thymine DNA glycosylase [Exaiptasia diaphana]